MYDLDEFDACYLDHKSSLDEDKQKYLDMLIKLRKYNCSRYYELFVRGTNSGLLEPENQQQWS